MTLTMIAIPALSSPPNNVVPSVTTSSWPSFPFRVENSFGLNLIPVDNSISPPSYFNTLALTSLPDAELEVSI